LCVIWELFVTQLESLERHFKNWSVEYCDNKVCKTRVSTW